MRAPSAIRRRSARRSSKPVARWEIPRRRWRRRPMSRPRPRRRSGRSRAASKRSARSRPVARAMRRPRPLETLFRRWGRRSGRTRCRSRSRVRRSEVSSSGGWSQDGRGRSTMARATTERDPAAVHDGDGRAPEGPGDLPKRSWWGVLRRTVREFKEDNLTDWAAALTYYGVLSIFPALLALVSVLGLIGPSATQPLIDNLGAVAPGPAKQIFTSAIQNLQKSSGAAGLLFIVGIAGALWSASGYVAAFMRASNAIYDVGEGRPIWKTLPTRVLTTLVLLIMLAAVTVAVTLTGGLAQQVGKLVGLGDAAVTVWDIA